MSSPLGTELKRSKYRLLGLVGQGQFGRVFCAAHRRTGRLVALKNLEHQRFPTHKFLRELRILLSLQHPNIVTCYALEHTRTGRYLVMDYCEGGTLRNLIDGDCRLSIAQAFQLTSDILAGLEHAHHRGIVHCDIKPDNILLNVLPTGWVARISDFGIARLTQELVGHEGLGNTGSPAYMAPERFYGQYSQSSDLYAVGVLLFELLAGYRPFSGTPAELMSGHLNRPLKLPESIPDVWHSILITALQKLPARRFRSASDMLVALRTAGAIAGCNAPGSNPSSIYLPLLQPLTVMESHPYIARHQIPLERAITYMAIAPLGEEDSTVAGLYCASEQQLTCYSNVNAFVTEPHSSSKLELSAPIKELISYAQGGCAITSTAVMLVSLQDSRKPNVITPSEHLCLAAVETQGDWLATVSLLPAGEGRLQFTKLQPSGRLASDPIPLLNRERAQHWVKLLALDRHHVAVVARVSGDESVSRKRSKTSVNTVFEVLTRRGTRLGMLSIPVCLTQIHPTLTPYRLMATDEHDPYALVIVDLKPFRVLRFGVEIAPVFLESTAWGYILVDVAGQIVLLDKYGQRIGRIEGPSHPTAIASVNSHELIVATWNGEAGFSYVIDLQELGVDLLF
ncbi:MAG: serine/threonine-protein kinase [Oculatellaceae cyanobacterium bins.114]|nr:serine/threonine-protein kinase [Oculatellaceae cyanobacterium bins.114]